MYYRKTEEYDFIVPREYKAYLAFKNRLNEMGIKFTEQHHSMTCTITVTNRAEFEVNDACDILELIKEDN